MKRLDFHIHTVKTRWDSQNFTFDLDSLRRYVSEATLDAIAITNHNVFDSVNYQLVSEALDIPVFPGIEINVTKPGSYGHVLLIADKDSLDDFIQGSESVAGKISGRDHISWDDVLDAYPGISNYLVVPHYLKDKKLDGATIDMINKRTGVDALEVGNNKKWLANNSSQDTPLVVFSDSRPGLRMPNSDDEPEGRRYAYGSTCVHVDELSIRAIKLAFQDKKNVTIFVDDHEFEILPEGIPASSRLNVVLGPRSTGKTFTLKRIMDAYGPESCFYLEQFEITNAAKEEVFNRFVETEDAGFFDCYFKPFQELISDYLAFDCDSAIEGSKDYCEALITFANSMEDDWSETPIYQANNYSFELDRLRADKDIKLRQAIRTICEESARKKLIEDYVDIESLELLDAAIAAAMKSDFLLKSHKEKTNSIVDSIKAGLESKASRKPLPAIDDLKQLFRYYSFEDRLEQELERLLNEEELLYEPAGKFKKKRLRRPVKTAADARKGVPSNAIPTGTSIEPLIKASATPNERLQAMRALQEITRPYICKLLFRIVTRIVVDDEREKPLSGGQRAEYLLLHKLDQAKGKDIALIDEPESSFDNPFLNSDVSEMINKLAESTTVFLVTHNNSLGVSIHPDWVLYTSQDSEGNYGIHSGCFTSSVLQSNTGPDFAMSEKLIESMEAGEPAYLDRAKYYGLA